MSPSARPAVQAAGAVVWRVERRRIEVLLVHRPRYDDWSWPKGKLDPGESLPACAVREVAEETGVTVVLGQRLGTVRYKLRDGRRKEAHYWAATPADDEAQACVAARGAVQPAEPTEIDETRWVDAATARRMLTNAQDRDLLGVLLDQWKDEKLRTWTMAVVRHGRARKRSAWKGDESTRPLTTSGQQRAAALVPLLAAFGVVDVISSPWERCAATVRPYLEATGVGAELHPELTEAAHKAKPKPVRQLVRKELTERSAPVALCTHRPVLPTVVAEIAGRTPHRIMKQVPASDPWLRTGEVLVVHVSKRPGRGAVVVALEKHRPSR